MRRLASTIVALAILALLAPGAQAASEGLVTIVDGRARLLRGASFYGLKEGMALQASDIIETEDKTHVQVEFPDGSSCGLGPFSSAYLSALPAGIDRPGNVFLHAGWLKVSNPATAGLLRGSTSTITLQPKGGSFVLQRQGTAMAFFVESGELLTADAAKSSPRTGLRRSGDFVEIRADHTVHVLRRPSAAFLAALPRPFADTLPSRLGKFAGKKVDPVLERQLSFEEADAWVKAHPAQRKALLRRFAVRLKDADFRHQVEKQLSRYPEWDRLLHPEKYLPITGSP